MRAQEAKSRKREEAQSNRLDQLENLVHEQHEKLDRLEKLVYRVMHRDRVDHETSLQSMRHRPQMELSPASTFKETEDEDYDGP